MCCEWGEDCFLLDNLMLSYPPFGDMHDHFATGSLSEKGKYFGERGGIIPFFEKDNLD